MRRYRVIEQAPASLEVSVVVPVKDEVENVAALAQEIRVAMERSAMRWECVWIDDGSSDGTGVILARLAGEDPRHRVVTLEGNHGQSAALAVGFSAARGEILATLDGDGQSDPADVPRLVTLLREQHADMVNGRRARRQDSLVRKVSSRVGNAFRNWLTREQVRDVGCSVRVFRRGAVGGLFIFRGMHRFLPTLVRLNGFERILETQVNHRPRLHGKTKYGIKNRLWVGIGDVLAVRWLQDRVVAPRVRPAAESSAPARERTS